MTVAGSGIGSTGWRVDRGKVMSVGDGGPGKRRGFSDLPPPIPMVTTLLGGEIEPIGWIGDYVLTTLLSGDGRREERCAAIQPRRKG